MQEKLQSPNLFFNAPSTDPQRIYTKILPTKKTSRDFHHPKASQSCSFMGENEAPHMERRSRLYGINGEKHGWVKDGRL